MNLLSREEFREKAIARDKRCVMCNSSDELSVHHILDRSLFSDGGYYIENAATLCPTCHIEAEKGKISCSELRKQCKIQEMALPPQLTVDKEWDKWGNETVDGEIIEYNEKTFDRFMKCNKG